MILSSEKLLASKMKQFSSGGFTWFNLKAQRLKGSKAPALQ
jgi:hypothetical protein